MVEQTVYPYTTSFSYPHTTAGTSTKIEAVCCTASINTDNTCRSAFSAGYVGQNFVTVNTT
jgi:hypothetical protein